jgi:hypothetical protein
MGFSLFDAFRVVRKVIYLERTNTFVPPQVINVKSQRLFGWLSQESSIKDVKSTKRIVNFDVNWLNFFFLEIFKQNFFLSFENVQRWTTFEISRKQKLHCVWASKKALHWLKIRRRTLEIMLVVYVGRKWNWFSPNFVEDGNYGSLVIRCV